MRHHLIGGLLLVSSLCAAETITWTDIPAEVLRGPLDQLCKGSFNQKGLEFTDPPYNTRLAEPVYDIPEVREYRWDSDSYPRLAASLDGGISVTADGSGYRIASHSASTAATMSWFVSSMPTANRSG